MGKAMNKWKGYPMWEITSMNKTDAKIKLGVDYAKQKILWRWETW